MRKSKTMKMKPLILLFVALFSYASCSDSSPLPEPEIELKTTKELLSFVLEKNNNKEYLDEDIVSTIEGKEILLRIPEKVDVTKLVATFTHNGEAVLVGDTPQQSGVSVNDFSKALYYKVVAEDNSKKEYVVKIDWVEKDEEKSQIPHIYIDTDNGTPIVEKRVYIDTDISIVGGNKYDDFEGRGKIRGRGNSTWGMPKKPYRFKLDKAASLLGLAAEKNWVLLQNYIDPSLMGNAIAMKIGQLLEMPFTHHMIPVDVTLNGEYIGNYTFTEHKEVTENRINVGEGGWLVELDVYYDEEYKFYSKNYELPVMIQHPELDKMSKEEAKPIFDEMKDDFNALDELIFAGSFPNNDYLEYFDARAFVNYLIVYTLTSNREINWPKSTYIYKKKGGKYNMGPIWDFDWAFGYEGPEVPRETHFTRPNIPLLGGGIGGTFFSRIAGDPAIKKLYSEVWADFKSEKYPILVEYIREYAESIRESHANDQERWGQSTDSIDKYLKAVLDWLELRVVYMDGLA